MEVLPQLLRHAHHRAVVDVRLVLVDLAKGAQRPDDLVLALVCAASRGQGVQVAEHALSAEPSVGALAALLLREDAPHRGVAVLQREPGADARHGV